MRHLNIDELNDIQGGGIAGRVLNIASNIITTVNGLYEATLFLRQLDGEPAYSNINPMGDYSGESCRF
jgi:hypothetical protein